MSPFRAYYFDKAISGYIVRRREDFNDPSEREIPYSIRKGFDENDIAEAGGVCAGESGAVEC